jgi:hypothetical protein
MGGYCWISLVQYRHKWWAVVHTAMNLPVPYLLTGCGAVGFSRSAVTNGVCCFLYKFKCRSHCKIYEVFCEVEHTHAQTDDAPRQLNRSFSHDTVEMKTCILSLYLGKE